MTDDPASVRADLTRLGLGVLQVEDLCLGDLPHIAWSGDPYHRRLVTEALHRVQVGRLEYLTARMPGGRPVAKVCIDFIRYPESGYLHQFATDPALQGLGVGTYLLTGAESRIRNRGVRLAQLAVEQGNERAQALYVRLGYEANGQGTEEWGHTEADGAVRMRRVDLVLLRKTLS